jgi:hypothetical protein
MSKTKIIYKIPTRVKNLELKKRIVMSNIDRSKPLDPDKPVPTASADATTEIIGWYVHFEGSYESLFVGDEKPDNLSPGTEVDILIIPKPTQA